MRKHRLFPVMILMLTVTVESVAQPVIQEINSGWKFHKVGNTDWYKAVVPGCVHTDLISNKIIPDPFYRDNESKLQWIDKYSWEYKTEFTVDKNLLSRENIELGFEGLDTYAEVFLNDNHILSTDNMFCEWNVEVKKYLVEGRNSLRILFHSPVAMGILSRDKFNIEAPLGYNLELTNTDWPNVGPYIRKAGYMFGWDWGPRLTTSGIWRPVFLKAWDEARILSMQIVQDEVSAKNASVSAIFTIESNNKITANLGLTYSLNGKTTIVSPVSVNLKEGKNEARMQFSVANPSLWWPYGLGDHPLYEISGTLEKDNKLIDTKLAHAGLRKVRLVQDPLPDGGKSFYFEVNGIPVFAKGANYIPSDIFPSRVTGQHYEEIINAAVNANMNMLRVWGGGIYEDDIFYDLCDRNGIMVWQDFAFAIYHMPDYPEFIESIKKELKDNIERLRNHPSLVLWSGNNETEVIWDLLMKYFFGLPLEEGSMGSLSALLKLVHRSDSINPKVTARVMKAYDDVFYGLIPEAIGKYDFNSHDYWPSSPSGGWKKPMTVKAPFSGDMHFYIAVVNLPFSSYLETRSRFFSEHGFQSWPDRKTVYNFTSTADRDKNSPVMKAHNKAMGGNPLLDKYMALSYKPAKDFDSYIYISQVLQAEGMKFALETHRRWMPFTMGSLFWQMNDVWPVASWSCLDFQNNPKPFYYTAKKAFEPVIVVPANYKNDFTLSVVSDKQQAFSARIEMKILDFSGKMLWSKNIPVSVPANTSKECFKIGTGELIGKMDTTRIVFTVRLVSGNKVLASNACYFSEPKYLNLEKTEITKVINRTVDGYSITLSADKLVKDLCLEAGLTGWFSDNCFDLIPGEKVTVTFRTKETSDNFGEKLGLFSLVDSY
ncbi:MAG TPA: glycoside hydrolase family 2 protein [Bacteroidales bacterium]|nr:glycoside hydrolase family 2 protein [Bacteroidales bacterium]